MPTSRRRFRTAPAAVLDAVADAIGEAAGTSFLVARIVATTEATVTDCPAQDPGWRATLPRNSGQAMGRDLTLRLGKEADRPPGLLPLAYAKATDCRGRTSGPVLSTHWRLPTNPETTT